MTKPDSPLLGQRTLRFFLSHFFFYFLHEACSQSFARDRRRPRNRGRDLSHKLDLVSSLEPEPLLRKSFCRSDFQRARVALLPRISRAVRNHQSQRQTERCLAGASTDGDRALEKRPLAIARIPVRSANHVTKAFHPCPRMVRRGPGRRGEMAVSQLSRQSA